MLCRRTTAAALAGALLANGWPADAQAVVIYNGTLPSQDTVTGTMGELLEIVREHPRRRQAAILVAGRVAGLREHLRWYDSRVCCSGSACW